MTKVQLSLTAEETAILEGYGAQFGYSLPKTIRFVISKASEEIVREGVIRTYPMSEETEAKGLEALREYQTGRTTKVEGVKKFFDSL
jgi:hypothetical protein